MKKYDLVILALFFCTLYYSCKKENKAFFSPGKTFIEEAKLFYTDSIINNQSIHSGGIPDQTRLINEIKKTPVWAEAKLKVISIGKAIVIPLAFETVLFGSSNFGSSERISIEKVAKLLIYNALCY